MLNTETTRKERERARAKAYRQRVKAQSRTLTAERLRSLFHYDEQTGVFTRLVSIKRAYAGDVAGARTTAGYLVIKIDERQYKAHRLAWLYVHGEWPAGDIDHIDTVRDHNWIKNLRDASPAINAQNRRQQQPGAATGLLGVWRNRNRFAASILVKGKRLYLGAFDTADQAHAAYVAAKRLHHPGCTI